MTGFRISDATRKDLRLVGVPWLEARPPAPPICAARADLIALGDAKEAGTPPPPSRIPLRSAMQVARVDSAQRVWVSSGVVFATGRQPGWLPDCKSTEHRPRWPDQSSCYLLEVVDTRTGSMLVSQAMDGAGRFIDGTDLYYYGVEAADGTMRLQVVRLTLRTP